MNLKKTVLALSLAALVILPGVSDARGFSSGRSFGGGGFSRSYSSFSSSSRGWSGMRSYSSPSRGWSSPSFRSSWAARSTPAIQHTTVVNNYRRSYGGGCCGGSGFFSGMMMGSMMSHPYYYGGGYGYAAPPPAYYGGYGYDVVGGYGVSGYAVNGVYYPYSPVGQAIGAIFGLLTVFILVYFIVWLLIWMWRHANDFDDYDDDC